MSSATTHLARSSQFSPAGYRLLFGGTLLALHLLLAFFPDLLAAFGVAKLDIWFRDFYAMLAASDSARAGHDPFVYNPFDLIGERHIYSDWWYGLGHLGLNRSHYLWVGGTVVVAFWTAVILILPFRSSGDFWWSLVICGSPPFWLAVNRANPDLLLFAIVSLTVPLILHRHLVIRLLSPLPIALATGLKYFPVLAGIILLTPGKSRNENRFRAGIIGLLGALLIWFLRDDVRNYLDVSWLAQGQFVFGAASIPHNFSLDVDFWLWGGRVCGILLVVWSVWRAIRGSAKPAVAGREERLYALMGAAVLAGNYFLTIGFLYKVIFVVWLLPQCLRLSVGDGNYGRASRWFLGGLVLMLWVESIMCVTSFQWLQWTGANAEIPIRRMITSLAGIFAWVAMVPAVYLFGYNLKVTWFPTEGRDSGK